MGQRKYQTGGVTAVGNWWRVWGVFVAIFMFPDFSYADSFDRLGNLTQSEFLTLSQNVSAATHYKAISPAEPLGVPGFDVALELSSTAMDSGVLDRASSDGFRANSMLVPRLHFHLGLPFKLDVGAFLTEIPETEFRAVGAEIRYSFLEGGILTPALAVRATYSVVSGAELVDFDHMGLEASLSKGFLMFTPYIGIGIVRSRSMPTAGELTDESFHQQKLFAGLNVNLGINLGFEADRTGTYESYSIKAGVRF